MNIRDLLFSGDLAGIENALRSNPSLASEEIALPDNSALAVPLHRVCDGVFSGNYSEDIGLELARVFLKYGAKLNPDLPQGKDSPLTAACSLHCDKLALLYIDQGADIHHRGCHGGTALHWAAWTGRDVVVKRLVDLKADVNERCIDFKSTPLFWAIHGHKFGGNGNRHYQQKCAELLLAHGADTTIPNFEGYQPAQLLNENDLEMLEIFRQ
jgi:uncharacterized protein